MTGCSLLRAEMKRACVRPTRITGTNFRRVLQTGPTQHVGLKIDHTQYHAAIGPIRDKTLAGEDGKKNAQADQLRMFQYTPGRGRFSGSTGDTDTRNPCRRNTGKDQASRLLLRRRRRKHSACGALNLWNYRGATSCHQSGNAAFTSPDRYRALAVSSASRPGPVLMT